ncbi:hypothetical protein BJX70DRAFT_373425 [Aspergillus crustosus]
MKQGNITVTGVLATVQSTLSDHIVHQRQSDSNKQLTVSLKHGSCQSYDCQSRVLLNRQAFSRGGGRNEYPGWSLHSALCRERPGSF